MSNKRLRQSGFSFIQSTSVLLTTGLLAVMGLPMIDDLKAETEASGTQVLFAEALALGRNHAVTKGQSVKVCGSSDGKTCSNQSWAGGWIVQSIGSDDGSATDASQVISAYRLDDLHQSLRVMDEKLKAVAEIRFDSQGFNKTQQRLEASICSPDHKPIGEMVIVERNGRVRVSSNPSSSVVSDAGKSTQSSQCRQV